MMGFVLVSCSGPIWLSTRNFLLGNRDMGFLTRIASRVAKIWTAKNNAFDTEMAIKQILLRSGWQELNGKIQKRVKSKHESFPKIYVVDTISNKMLVKGHGGKIISKVDLSSIVTPDDIHKAAKTLNDSVMKVVLRHDT